MASKDHQPRFYIFELWLTAIDSDRPILQRLSQFAADLSSDPVIHRTPAMKPHMRLASFQCDTRHPSLDFVGQFETPVWAQYTEMPHSASARDALVIDLLPSEDLYELYSKVLTNLHDRGDLVVFKQDLRFPPLQLFPNTDIAGRQHLRNVLGTQGRLRQWGIHRTLAYRWDSDDAQAQVGTGP